MIKRCGRCQQDLPLASFNKNAAKRDGLHSHCRECKKVAQHAWYVAHKEEHRAKVKIRRKTWSSIDRTWLNDLKSNPCVDCGGSFPPYVMDFDHLPGTDKITHVSAMIGMSRQRILEEIAKCELVCANCHRIRTFTRA